MRITQRTPRPTAPPTSSLPARAGRWVWGRDTKPRTWPPGVASTRMLPSGPSPLHWSDTRSSAFESPPRRSPAVRARPSAAVAVGSVPCRTRASSTSSVVTAARPRTVPSALSVRARRSATACLVHGAQHLGSADQTREAAALAAVRTEEDERRHTGHAEAAAERARALVLGGDVDLDHHEVGCRAHDRGVPERGTLHLAARQAPRGLEVEEDGPTRGGGARERLVGERDPGDRALGLGTQEPDQRERHQRDPPGAPRPAHDGRRRGPEEAEHDTRRDEQQARRDARPGVGQERGDEVERKAQEEKAEDALHPLEPGAGAWQHAKPSGQRRQREVGRTEPEPEHEERAKPSATDCCAPTKRRSASTAGPMQGAATTPMVRPMKKAPRSPSPTRPRRCMSGEGTRS